jgi:hypothetical protein
VIYFVRAGDQGPVKIGHVEDPATMEHRLSALQTGNPVELYIAAEMPGDPDEERMLHRHFAEGRMRGEWFRADTPGLRELISDAVQREALRLWEAC